MAHYLVRNCLTNLEETVVTDTILTPGQIILYGSTGLSGIKRCGTVLNETVPSAASVLLAIEENCIDCVRNNGINLEFLSCVGEENYLYVPGSEFIDAYGELPTINQIFNLYNTPSQQYNCASFVGDTSNLIPYGNTYYSGPHEDCDCSYKYNAIDCLTSQNIGTLGFTETQTFGTNISVTDGVNYYCVTIGNPVTGTITLTAVTSYETCFDCLTGTPGINISVNKCNDDISYVVPTTGFTSLSELTQVTYICLEPFEEEKICICGTFTQTNDLIDTTLLSVGDVYQTCDTCLYFNTPRSANTETIICESCDGLTVREVTAPHPVWTDAQGVAVTQMNAVTLGGMFGLNS